MEMMHTAEIIRSRENTFYSQNRTKN